MHEHTHEHRAAPQPIGTEKDPVCGMQVGADTPHRYTYGGKEYRFCSSACREQFVRNPAKYVAAIDRDGATHQPPVPAKATTAGAAAEHHGAKHVAGAGIESTCPMHPEVRQPKPGACPTCGMALEPVRPVAPAIKTEWTCPMHPQIVRDAPGSCPICGMALEPRTVSLEEQANPDLVDMTRRFWVSALLAIPLVALAMFEMFRGAPALGAATPWVELVLATPVVLWGGLP